MADSVELQESSDDDKAQECLKVLKHRVKGEVKEMDPFWYENSEFLLRFIRVKNFDVDQSLIMLKRYLALRKKHSNYLINLTPSAYKFLFDLGTHTVLKSRDSLGRKVFVFRLEKWNLREISVDQVMSATILLLEEMLESKETQRNGVIFLADLTGCGFEHFLKFRFAHVRAIASVFLGNFPIKCKGLHSVNEPTWHGRFTNFFITFFSSKLQKRMHFHGKNRESLHEILPQEILPNSLGGTLTWEEANDTEFFDKMYSKEEYYKVTSSLRE